MESVYVKYLYIYNISIRIFPMATSEEQFDELNFILAIQQKPLLWDKSEKDYHNQQKKLLIWKQLAEVFQWSPGYNLLILYLNTVVGSQSSVFIHQVYL